MSAKKSPLKGFKEHLPTKVCPMCALPFSWRKRWRNNWERVIYCSEKCRRAARTK
jgi:hypothetical protein